MLDDELLNKALKEQRTPKSGNSFDQSEGTWKPVIGDSPVELGPELPPEPEPIEEVSEEERLRRYSICQSCAFFEKVSTVCKKSGCYMENMSRRASYDCPWGEW